MDLIEIRWPSGVVQQLENVSANQLLQVVEVENGTDIDNEPIRIEAEDYAPGGQGISYLDAGLGNVGGAYRSDDVDIQPTSDVGDGFNVGWTNSGEWLTYDLDLPEGGTYDLVARVATPKRRHTPLQRFHRRGSRHPGVWQHWRLAVLAGCSSGRSEFRCWYSRVASRYSQRSFQS